MAKQSLDEFLHLARRLAAIHTNAESTDKELLRRFLNDRDENAFTVLVERYGSLVLRTCRRSLGNPHDAEDATQATFLVFARKARSIRDASSIGGWLHSVTIHVCATFKREQARRQKRERSVIVHESTHPTDEICWSEVRTAIDEELIRLSDRSRTAITLCYLDGLTRDQAADRMNITIGALHGLLERGRKVLANRLSKRGLTLSSALLGTAFGSAAFQGAWSPNQVLATVQAVIEPQKSEISDFVVSLSERSLVTMRTPTMKLFAFSGILLTSLLLSGFASNPFNKSTSDKEILTPSGLRLGDPRFRHPGQTEFSLSADGKQLITFSQTGKTIRFWDTASGNLIREMTLVTRGNLWGFAWPGNGKFFAMIERIPATRIETEQTFISLRDKETGREIRAIPYQADHYDGKEPLQFLPGEQEIAVTTAIGIGIWEVETGLELIQHRIPRPVYTDFTISRDGKKIAFVGNHSSGEIMIWEWDSGKEPKKLQTGLKKRFNRMKFSPDGKYLAVVSDLGGGIQLIDSENGKPIRTLEIPEGRRRLQNMVFSPDGKKLFVADDGGRLTDAAQMIGGVVTFDVETERILDRWKASGEPGKIVLSANGKFLALQARGMPVWDTSTGKRLCSENPGDSVNVWQVTTGKGLILTQGEDLTALLWDDKTGQLLYELPHQKQVRGIAVSPDGTLAATASYDDTLGVWNTKTGKRIYSLPGHGRYHMGGIVQFTSDSKRLVSFGSDLFLRVTDLNNGKAIREFALRPGTLKEMDLENPSLAQRDLMFLDAVFSPDGSRLLVRTSGQEHHVFDTDSGKEIHTFKVPLTGSSKSAFSFDGRYLLTQDRNPPIETPLKGGGARYESSKENPLRCWDLMTGKTIWDILIPSAGDKYLAFSPDGKIFAISAGRSAKKGRIEFHDTQSGNLLGLLDSIPNSVGSIAFTSDGKRIAGALDDQTVWVGDVPLWKSK